MNLIVKTFEETKTNIDVIIDSDGEPWFMGKQIAKILGYKNTKDAIITHIESTHKKSFRLIKQGSGKSTLHNIHPQTIFINESGLYDLVLGSKKSMAKKFRKWITDDVLPSIRKTGKYQIQKQIDNISAKERHEMEMESKRLDLEIKQAEHQMQKENKELEHKNKELEHQMQKENKELALRIRDEFIDDNDILLQQAIRDSCINAISAKAITFQEEEKIVYLDIAELKRRNNLKPDPDPKDPNNSKLGKYVSKQYKEKFETKPPQAIKVVNGAQRMCNVYSSENENIIVEWIRHFLNNGTQQKNNLMKMWGKGKKK